MSRIVIDKDSAILRPTSLKDSHSVSVAPPPAPPATEAERALERAREAKKGARADARRAAGEPVRVFADGIYDLFHAGHANSLRQAKHLFDNVTLIVGVCSDEVTMQHKGRTVMPEDVRYASVAHCRWVDEIIPASPWSLTPEFLDEHDIDYVTHGEDASYDADGNDVYAWLKDAGRFLTIKRTPGVSTSDIILTIVRDYDSYVQRNLARGYSAAQLNVGFFKENQLKMRSEFARIRDAAQGFVSLFQQQARETLSSIIPSPSVSPTPSVEGTENDDEVEEEEQDARSSVGAKRGRRSTRGAETRERDATRARTRSNDDEDDGTESLSLLDVLEVVE